MQGPPELSERQKSVLRALVASYVAAATPVGSQTLSHVLSVRLSSASVRNTLAELSEMGLIEKPHASAGRIPTEEGFRVFVDELLAPGEVERHARRSLDRSFGEVDPEGSVHLASQLLSDHTHLLGFGLAPRLEALTLQRVSFVRLSTDRVLAVLVDTRGRAHSRELEDPWRAQGLAVLDQAKLDRMASALAERVAGHTLRDAHARLEREVRSLRNRADRLLEAALTLGLCAAEAALEDPSEGDLVIATRLALLDQPEFHDPARVRDLFAALEHGERLVDLLEQLIEQGDVAVALGEELARHGLSGCAVVAAPCGSASGMVGVIGPQRMDYARIIPLVGYCSQLVADKLSK